MYCTLKLLLTFYQLQKMAAPPRAAQQPQQTERLLIPPRHQLNLPLVLKVRASCWPRRKATVRQPICWRMAEVQVAAAVAEVVGTL